MDVANFTEHENQKTFRELFCSPEITTKFPNELIFLSALNIFLSITAFLGNTLILVALKKETSLHPSSKVLFRSLATTDLCVGISAEPLAVVYLMSVVNERWDVCYYAQLMNFATAGILCTASFFTLTAISVDRLLALLLGLRYRHIVTSRRAYIAVTAMWVFSIFSTSSNFWNLRVLSWFFYIGLSVCLAITIFSYTKIFYTLHRRQHDIKNDAFQGQPTRPTPLNIVRYRKAVSSALWLQVALVVCYLPYSIVVALILQKGFSSSLYLSWQVTGIPVYLNSSLNPILYCWKIREVRQAAIDTLKRLFCKSH